MISTLKKNKKPYIAPLFDRLSESGDTRLDLDGLKDSIAKEVSCILNTRLVLRTRDDEDQESTYPYFFGLEDFSRADIADQPTLKRRICKLLRRYEPRLQCPEVVFFHHDTEKCMVALEIGGFIKSGEKRFYFTFPIQLSPQT